MKRKVKSKAENKASSKVKWKVKRKVKRSKILGNLGLSCLPSVRRHLGQFPFYFHFEAEQSYKLCWTRERWLRTQTEWRWLHKQTEQIDLSLWSQCLLIISFQLNYLVQPQDTSSWWQLKYFLSNFAKYFLQNAAKPAVRGTKHRMGSNCANNCANCTERLKIMVQMVQRDNR